MRAAFAEHEAEVNAIAGQTAAPDFVNTIAALELSGRALARVEQVFGLLVGADSDDALLQIERELSPQVASHWNKFRTNAALFRRIDTLMRQSDTLGLTAEQKRVLERYHTSLSPRRRRTRRRSEAAPGRDRRAPGGAGHHVQPERAC